MSEQGVFAVDRGIWDHPFLKEDNPLSKREAWLWLVSEAAWKPKKCRVAGKNIELARGQLCHAIRFMAAAWKWPKTNVARFLAVLRAENMIWTEAGTEVTVITICKYNEYQRVSLPSGTKVGQEWDRLEDIKDKKVSMARKRARPKVPLPENWHPMEALSSEDHFELNRFKDHARANDRRCVDWFAAWRNWKTSPYRKTAPVRRPYAMDGII